ncbi:MAG TPA: hypothetical protein VK393_09615 [Nocardioidaceae bacterium]|nr:hypothetical protein [Nocardioidaceae bacterium]
MSLAAPTAGQRRVFLHVGAPKTGTTFLQDVLWTNRAALVEAGVCYPLRRADEHFAATMDLRQMAWGRERDPQWEGAWERIAARVRAWPGPTAVISNELLGGASAEQVAAAVASLAPAQVHVVFTARDLARQLPSDWQEHLKHLHVVPFDRFVEDLVELGTAAPAPFGEMFWRLHDPVDVLDRWVSAVPAAHVHLVTVPQPDAPTGLLWERFAAILGLDPAAFDTNVGRSNTSLGVVDCELLRRVNRHLRGKIDLRHYDPLVRLRLTSILLAAARPGPASEKLTLPASLHPWALERSRELVAGIEAAGYEVVGDLDELLPPRPTGGTPSLQPAEVDSDALLESALVAISGLLRDLAHGRDQSAEHEAQLARWRQRPLRQWLIDRSGSSRTLMAARRGYWWLANQAKGRHG